MALRVRLKFVFFGALLLASMFWVFQSVTQTDVAAHKPFPQQSLPNLEPTIVPTAELVVSSKVQSYSLVIKKGRGLRKPRL